MVQISMPIAKRRRQLRFANPTNYCMPRIHTSPSDSKYLMMTYRADYQQTVRVAKINKLTMEPMVMSTVSSPKVNISELSQLRNVEIAYNTSLKNYNTLVSQEIIGQQSPQLMDIAHVDKDGINANARVPQQPLGQQGQDINVSSYQVTPLKTGLVAMPLATSIDVDGQYGFGILGVDFTKDLSTVPAYHNPVPALVYDQQEEFSSPFVRGCSDRNGLGWICDLGQQQSLTVVKEVNGVLTKVERIPYPQVGMPGGIYSESWDIVVDLNGDIIVGIDTQEGSFVAKYRPSLGAWVGNRWHNLEFPVEEPGTKLGLAIDKYNNIWCKRAEARYADDIETEILCAVRNNNFPGGVVNRTIYTIGDIFPAQYQIQHANIYMKGMKGDTLGNVFGTMRYVNTPEPPLVLYKLQPVGVHPASDDSLNVTATFVDLVDALGEQENTIDRGTYDVSCEDELGKKDY